MKSKKNYYSKEFKENAVALSYQRSNQKELADELGIDVQRLYKWRKAKLMEGTPKAANGAISSLGSAEEIKGLKKELKNSQLELEILKKAVHIFSKSDGRSTNL
jgi:transposase